MGFAAGLQAGERLGQGILDAYNQSKEQKGFQEAMRMAPEEVRQRQATSEELGRAQAETQGLAAQDAAEFGLTPQDQTRYAPQMPVEGQRIGLSSYNLGGQTYDRMPTQQEIQQARYGAMADVIAERDPARGLEMRQRLEDQAARAERRPLELQSLKQGIALGGEQLTTAQRSTRLAAANDAAQNALAEMRAKNIPINSQSLAQLAKTHGADYNTLLSGELNQLGFNEKTAAVEMKNLSKEWSKAALGGTKSINKFLTDKFDPDKTDNITPELVQTKNGYVVMYGDKILSNYGTHKDLSTVIAQVHGMINDDPLGTMKSLASIKASEASARASDAAAGLTGVHGQLYGAQLEGLKQTQAAREQAAALGDKYAALTTAQQNGPEGHGLIRQINIANAKAGGQVNFGPVMTEPQKIAWGLVQKSEPWLRAEQKGDTSAMNKLLVGRGIDPGLIGLPGDAGWVPKPTTSAPAAAPAAVAPALVAEDRTRYVREKGPRGGYVYTVNPRGRTKAEFKAMDDQ